MGGYDIYCYKCGLPVYNLRAYFTKVYCNISPKFLEDLRLGYFRTPDGVIHNVKDFDTGGYFQYVNTDTNKLEEADPLLKKVNYNVFDVMCHRDCSKYLHPFTEPDIKKLFHMYRINGQFFDGITYAKKILPLQIKDKAILQSPCKSSAKPKKIPARPRVSAINPVPPVNPIKQSSSSSSKKMPKAVKKEKKDKKNDPDYIYNPTTKRWVKKTGKVGKMLMKNAK